MRFSRYAPWALFVALVTFGCGTPICVGPFAVTSSCYDQEADGAATSGSLTFLAHDTDLDAGQVITFQVQGGVSPYSFRRTSIGTMTQSGVYTAPTGEAGQAVTIEVEDAQDQQARTAVTIAN